MQIMYSKEVQVTNQVGLYARPATFFIQKANEFKSTILVEKEERRVNAKSLLGILSLGITKGTTINLIADGPDEEEAVSALVELITSNFTDRFYRILMEKRRFFRNRRFFNPAVQGVSIPPGYGQRFRRNRRPIPPDAPQGRWVVV